MNTGNWWHISSESDHMFRQFAGGRSEQLDRAGCAVETVHRRTKTPTEHATRHDRQLNRELQQVGIEQHLVPINAAAGVAVEATAFRAGIN